MAEQVFYEDVEVGSEIPCLVKHPTPRQLVKWAGASGDYYEIHYDKDFAQANGLPGIIVHGFVQVVARRGVGSSQPFLGRLRLDA